jgi:renalase
MRLAIIGAGMAGLSCADVLKAAGHTAELFDKGRGPGGRMSTRRMQTPLGEAFFDHGAQYFTVRDPAFRQLVDIWSDLGVTSPWPPAGAGAWVGIPGMNAVIRQLAAPHAVSWEHLVTGIVRKQGEWWLMGKAGESGPFDAVIFAIPAEQAAAILSLHDFALAQIALLARSQPCWTGMFVFDRPIGGIPPIIRDKGDIAWAARNNAKPDRSGPEAWVIQADAPWSRAHLEASAEDVSGLLHAALAKASGCAIPNPIAASAHRWRYALSSGTGDGALWNPLIGLGVCGDWLLGPRVECAWLSGRMLGRKVLGQEFLPSFRTHPKGQVEY